jgi:hypothetical protein
MSLGIVTVTEPPARRIVTRLIMAATSSGSTGRVAQESYTEDVAAG